MAAIPLIVRYSNIEIEQFYADIVVERKVILEIKASKCLASENEAQLLNYLKASQLKIGLLLNFGKPRLEWKRLIM